MLYGNAVMFLFCCDHFIIAVTAVGHRTMGTLRSKELVGFDVEFGMTNTVTACVR